MIVRNTIKLARDELSQKEWRQLLTKLTFNDANGIEHRSYRLLANGFEIPRGAWSLLPNRVEYQDRRVMPPAPWLDFSGELDAVLPDKSFTGQREALRACIEEEQGIVIRPPGTGKTQIALALVAELETNCIVFVHTEDIFNQWIEYAQKSLPGVKIGSIQGDEWNVERLSIAMVQTVSRDMDRWREVAGQFGCLIGDEIHHVAAPTWEMIVNSSPSKYRIGFTATDKRADGMQALMTMLMGPVLQRQKIELKIPTKIIPIKSGFYFPYRGRFDWGPLQEAIVNDEARNQKIADTAIRQMEKGQSVLILSRRIEHLSKLEELIGGAEQNGDPFRIQILTGKTPRPRRKKLVQEFRDGTIQCLLSTQLADEALDVPILSRVILTYPGKHDGRIIQQVGRALREYPGKEDAIIFDIVDDRIGVLRRQWMLRKEAYKKMKIPIHKWRNGDEVTPVDQAQHRRLSNDRIKRRMRRR